MEQLEEAIARQDWQQALALSSSKFGGQADQYIYQQQCINTQQPDLAILARVEDASFVAAICLQTLTNDGDYDQHLIQLGLNETADQSKFQNSEGKIESARQELLLRNDLLATWREIAPKDVEAAKTPRIQHIERDEDGWDLDLDTDIQEIATESVSVLPFELIQYLQALPMDIATSLASNSRLSELSAFLTRHSHQIPHQQLEILDKVPITTDAVTYLGLLPKLSGLSGECISSKPWRTEKDWSDTQDTSANDPIDLQTLSKWLRKRIEETEKAGMLEEALALVQHAASRNIPVLDALGQDLSLLSSLVYTLPPNLAKDNAWDLTRWRIADTQAIVTAYMSQSTPDSAAKDYRKLVQPFLYVREAKLEREGAANSSLHEESLRAFLFDRAEKGSREDIGIIASIIESSKPTLSGNQRLIKFDTELARIVLSCLYGCSNTNSWDIIASIFECLPAFQEAGEISDSTSILPAQNPVDYYQQVAAMSPAELSQAMDRLDVHLESAETLARWHVGQPLVKFLESDAQKQRQLATRIVRYAARSDGVDMESEDEWEALRDDMIKMGGGESELAKESAFSLISGHDLLQIFFSGLLNANRYSLAKALLKGTRGDLVLSAQEQETLVLNASLELYDNSESGNMHSGDMKSALDCLSVIKQTPAIKKQRELIEATSRLASYHLESRPGVPLLPAQIRLVQDRLSLLAKVITSNATAYQYPDVLVDLLAKLGTPNTPVSNARIQLTVGNRALQLGDFPRATTACSAIFEKTQNMTHSPTRDSLLTDACALASALTAHADNHTNPNNQKLLGYALLSCPPEEIGTLLQVWRESEAREQSHPARPASVPELKEESPRQTRTIEKITTRLPRRLQNSSASPDRVNSPSAALDAILHNGVDSLLHGREGGVRDKLNQRFTSGVSWLIGADHEAQQ